MTDDICLSKQTCCLLSTIITTCNASSTSGLPNSLSYTQASIAAVAALFCNIPKLSPDMWKTAVHVILQSQKIFKNSCETTKNGCLNMMYVELYGLREAQGVEAKEIQHLENATYGDLLDMVCSTLLNTTFSPQLSFSPPSQISTFEHTNGGISLYLYCSGFHAPENLTVKNLTVDAYLSPHEHLVGSKSINEETALLVQAFGEKIARPYLQWFMNRYDDLMITPPLKQSMCVSSRSPPSLTLFTVHGNQLCLKGPHLPTGEKTSYMLCRCVMLHTLRPAIAAAKGQGTSKYPIPVQTDSEDGNSIKANSDWTPTEECFALQFDAPIAVAPPGQLLPLSYTTPLANALLY